MIALVRATATIILLAKGSSGDVVTSAAEDFEDPIVRCWVAEEGDVNQFSRLLELMNVLLAYERMRKEYFRLRGLGERIDRSTNS